jgi:hypothetical protein
MKGNGARKEGRKKRKIELGGVGWEGLSTPAE